MGEAMKEATFSLAEANFAAGDFKWGKMGDAILYATDVYSCGFSSQSNGTAECRQGRAQAENEEG